MNRFEMFSAALDLLLESNRLMRQQLSRPVVSWLDARDLQTVALNAGQRSGKCALIQAKAAAGDLIITHDGANFVAGPAEVMSVEKLKIVTEIGGGVKADKRYARIWINNAAWVFPEVSRESIISLYLHDSDQTFIEIG